MALKFGKDSPELLLLQEIYCGNDIKAVLSKLALGNRNAGRKIAGFFKDKSAATKNFEDTVKNLVSEEYLEIVENNSEKITLEITDEGIDYLAEDYRSEIKYYE